MNNTKSVYSADWIGVSIGFSIACGISFYKIIYNYYLGKNEIKNNRPMADRPAMGYP